MLGGSGYGRVAGRAGLPRERHRGTGRTALQHEKHGSSAPPQQDYAAIGKEAAKADFTSASSSQGWEYDPEAMKALIKKLEDIYQRQRFHMEEDAGNLTQIDPMGNESVSKEYASYGNGSGSSYKPILFGSFDYLRSYIDTCIDIDQAYQDQDQAALDALRIEDA